MWKEFSYRYIRGNPAASLSIAIAALISAVFLSLLCSLFYNLWTYEIEKIVLEEGGWHARITGEIDAGDIAVIRNFENVESATINDRMTDARQSAVDIVLRNPRAAFEDALRIAEKLGLPAEAASFHLTLLSRYLIHDPRDPEPPLLMSFYLAVLLVVSLSLVLIIHNAFAVTMNARIRQFGILSSVGATPKQIRACLTQEAAALCALPILLGILIGIALSFGTIEAVNVFARDNASRHEAVFQYQPLVFAVTLAVSALTVWFSAWLPARKLGRLTPLQAIRNAGEFKLNKKRRARLLFTLFGIEGELAGNALKAQKRALRTSTLSLTLSFLGFTLMLCFFSLAGISTNHTYFERYQNAWDVMITVRHTAIADFAQADELRALSGVRDCVAYQRAAGFCLIPGEAIAEAVDAAGGIEKIAGNAVSAEDGGYLARTQMVILDDASFLAYCEEIGASPETGKTIVLNRLWNRLSSNFRNPEYLPYLRESVSSLSLQCETGECAELPICAFAEEPPALREEYENFALVQFVPLSLWRAVSGRIGGAEDDVRVRIIAESGASLAELDRLEAEAANAIGPARDIERENRLREKRANDDMLAGFKKVLGALCALLAVIGISNVFFNTLGFVRQRKREFAQYMSVGMTARGMKKLFCVEALVIASRPLLVTLPLAALSVWLMISASHIRFAEFWNEAPLTPVIAFTLAIFGFVALAYFVGGKKVLASDLVGALKSESVD